MSLRTLTLLVFAAGTLADPVAATAESGVHVDPGSPAGKEYAIPIDATRTDFGGGGGSGGAGNANTSLSSASSGKSAGPPLFGVGVTPATVKAALRPIGSRPGSTAPTTAATAERARAARAASTVSTTAAGGGIVGAMVVVAVLLTFLTRPRRDTQA